MRNQFLDLALSTGLEGLITPPVSEVVPSVNDLVVNETAFARDTTEVVLAESAMADVQSNLADLTRLATGLEGLMIEVAQIENQNDPTAEEMAALRVSAMAVRREFLSSDERRVVERIEEGRLSDGVEGLTDVMKSVSAKLNFAVGNFWDSLRRTVSTSKGTTQRAQVLIEDLIKRIQPLNASTFSKVLSKEQALSVYIGNKVDLKATFADIVPATDDWYRRPVNLMLDKIAQLTTDLEGILQVSSEEQYAQLTTAALSHFEVPVLEGSKNAEVVPGKYFTFDVWETHQSAKGRGLATWVPRVERNGQMDSEYYDKANAVSVAFAQMYVLSKYKTTPTEVSLSKQELVDGLQQLLIAIKNIDAYLSQMDMVYKAYGVYQQATRHYDAFLKLPFVTKAVQRQVGAHAGAILALFEMTFIPSAGTLQDIVDIAGVVKSLVYSSDQS